MKYFKADVRKGYTECKKPGIKYLKNNSENDIAGKLSYLFLFVYYVLPQYFGIDVGFDLTAQRMLVVLFLIFLLEKKERMQRFTRTIVLTPGVIWLLFYFVVLIYTAVFRVHIGTFLYSFFEFVGMYILAYIGRDTIGVKKTIKNLNSLGMLLCILGIIEFLMKKTPFSYLETLDGIYAGAYWRSGNYRIMGPANHSLGYGLMLVVMTPFACLDTNKDKIDIFCHFPYLVLIIINVFLTSSRSTMAVFGLMIILLFVFSDREKRRKTFMVGMVCIIILAALVVGTWGSSFSNYVMLQLTYIYDEIAGTTYAERYGADLTQLYNSREYRNQLPYIFHVGLNPVLGRGSQPSFGWEINGWYIRSIDNFYIAQYVRYAYPGLITYCLFILTNLLKLLRLVFTTKSGLFIALFIGISMYFLNIWWLDGLMTYKYVYILIALFIACYSEKRNCFVPYGDETMSLGDE